MIINSKWMRTADQGRNAQTINENVVGAIGIGEQFRDNIEIGTHFSGCIQQILSYMYGC